MLTCSIVVGLIAGLLSVKLENLEGAILAAWGFFLLGVLLNETVVWLAGKAWLFWTINISFALIGFVLGWKFTKHAEVLATAFIGSYMTMKGIGIMAGGFPNIYSLIKMINDGAIDTIDPVFYAYMAGVIIMFIGCSIFQFKFFFHKEQTTTHPYAMLN